MIRQLSNFTKKSFSNYSTSPDFFKRRNLIFGYNGRGKSSLSEGIIDEFLSQANSQENYRYFNRDFVKENLVLEDNLIKGVVATFSKKSLEIKNKVENLELVEKEIKKYNDEIELLNNTTRKLIDSKHNLKKGSLKIKKKRYDLDASDTVDSYKKDIEIAKKIQPDKQILYNYQGDNQFEKDIEQLHNIIIPEFSIDLILEDDYQELSHIFNKSFDNPDIPSSEIIAWLNKGISFHANSESCKFCDNRIDYNSIENKVSQYNDHEKQQSVLVLKCFIDKLDMSNKRISKEFKSNFSNSIKNNSLENDFSSLQEQMNFIDETVGIINNKILNMGKNIKLDIKKIDKSINIVNEIYERFLQIKKNKLTDLQKQLANKDTLVKGAIGLLVTEDLDIKGNLVMISKIRSYLKGIEEQMSEQRSIIKELKKQESDHNDFRIFLNEVLKKIEIDLELEVHSDGENYTLKHSKLPTTPLTIENISEGEKNLLALLFFYFELYEDKEQKILKKNIELLVIDDPVSSLDDANKFYVIELITKIFKEKQIQIFVLTHVWSDFCQLSYGNKSGKNCDYSSFEVYKNNNSNSDIRVLPSNDKPYKKLFKEIFEFSNLSNNHIPSHCELYHIPNSMRRVFEEFLQFKSTKPILPTQAQRSSVEEIINQSTIDKCINGNLIKDGGYLSISNNKDKLGNLLTMLNVLSHNAQYAPNQILQSAKFMMSLIKDMDKAHYDAMKQ